MLYIGLGVLLFCVGLSALLIVTTACVFAFLDKYHGYKFFLGYRRSRSDMERDPADWWKGQ